MNTHAHMLTRAAVLVAGMFLLSACATSPEVPEVPLNARIKLDAVQADSQLATRAQIELEEAQQAVQAAEAADADSARGRHLVTMADQKVEIARARAQSRLYEDQRQALTQESERARLQARTLEADRARQEVEAARADARSAREEAESMRGEAWSARERERDESSRADTQYRQDEQSRQDEAQAMRDEARAARAEARAAREEFESSRADAQSEHDEVQVARAEARAARDEVESARAETRAARAEAQAARDELQSARADAQSARETATSAAAAAAMAREQAAAAAEEAAVAAEIAAVAREERLELERQIEELNARETDRGLVVTLGDVLFATGESELQGAAIPNLNKLAAFLQEHDDRAVQVEGHTDSVGSRELNQALSERRAESVKDFLVGRGIDANRITTSGLGLSVPVASNDTPGGRAQNRRVEVIISNDERVSEARPRDRRG